MITPEQKTLITRLDACNSALEVLHTTHIFLAPHIRPASEDVYLKVQNAITKLTAIVEEMVVT